MSVLSLSASAFLVAAVLLGDIHSEASTAAFLLSALSMSVVMYFWVRLYSDSDNRGGAGLHLAGSIALGGVFEVLTFSLQMQFVLFMVTILPLLGALLFRICKEAGSTNSFGSAPRENPPSEEDRVFPPFPSNGRTEYGLSWKLLCALVVFGIAAGLTQFLFMPISGDTMSQAVQLRLVSRYCIALTVFLGAAMLSWKPQSLYRAGSLIVIAGFLALPFLSENLGYLGSVLANAGYTCVELMVWTVVFESARINRSDAVAPVAVSRLIMALSTLLGMLLTYLLGAAQASAKLSLAVSSLVVYAMVIVTVMILGENGSSKSWYLIERSFTEREDTSSLSEQCRRISSSANLTARELDVLVLLAEGRSAPFISNELNIATSTVNYHVRHIYEKLGVKSKQDLIGLVRKS